MVVVKRASGAVETRTIDPLTPGASSTEGSETAQQTGPTEASGDQQQQQQQSEAPTITVRPAAPPPPSALFEEVPESETFGEMFEKSAKDMPSRKSIKVGDKVKAKIFQLGADTAFLTLGGKSEAMIDLGELKDAEGVLRKGVGDEVEGFVIEAGAKGTIVSMKLPKGAASLGMLAEARANGMPVEGLVLAVNKGGLEVAVGDVRAFCPSSQVDIRFVGKLDSFVGERLLFRVTEVKERNVVLSRRAILEEEQKVKAVELRKSLAVGNIMKGTVTGVRDFGVFVDLGGLEGMIPVSELSHVRVGHPSEVTQVGDTLEVEVIRIEQGEPNSPDKSKRKERIGLSLRSRQEDPWKVALEEFTEGSRVKGKVARLQPFGAFVELKPGVDGLIHISAMSDRRIAHPRDVLRVGDEVEVLIEKTDPVEKRLALRLIKDGVPVGEGAPSASAGGAASEGAAAAQPSQPREPREPRAEAAAKPRRGQVVTGKVERIEPFGVFIAFPGGKGLIPASETGTERGTDLKRVFPMGKEVTAEIIEAEGSKLKLSVIAAVRSEERADLEAWKKTQKPQGGGKTGFGTLGDKLKGLKLS